MEKISIGKIKPNPKNPRFIRDDKFRKLVESVKSFPEMSAVRPVVVNKQMVILGGNMRYRAMKEAGYTEIDVTVVDWPKEKQDEFVIKDNVSGGEWDWSLLANEWDEALLNDWGLTNMGASGDLDKINDTDEWAGMPEFAQSEDSLKIIIHFETESQRTEFLELHPMEFSKREKNAWITWFPFRQKDDVKSLKYDKA